MPKMTRREAIVLGAGGTALTLAGWPSAALADAKAAADEVAKFTGGKAAEKGNITIELPEIAENGNTVPMTVSVESPMTEQSYVTEVLVIGDGNPRAGMATFHFSPLSGVAEANTRVRLAATQNITAIAKMNDGSFYTVSKQVKVTIGGCGG